MALNIGAALVQRLEKIPWLSACGQKNGLEDVTRAAPRAKAEKAIKSTAWENVQLDRPGDFTTRLWL